MIIAVSCFSKHSIVDIWQGSAYASGSEYLRVLNMSLVLNVLEFWIYQGSKYASGFKYARILNNQSTEYARVTQGSECAWIFPDYVWLYLNMPDYVGKCLNMPKYAWICLNLPEWLLFCISPVVTLLRGDLFVGLQETRVCNLEEHEAVFLKRQNLTFSIAPGSIIHLFFVLD